MSNNKGYPPVGFYFKVTFAGKPKISDTSFQEISGIDATVDTEEYVEGGENRFVHQLPKGIKHSNLTLKRGIAPSTSPLAKWCCSVFRGEFKKPLKTMTVSLMDEKQTPIRAWSFNNVYPIKWAIDPFNSTKNEVAIETIEMSYNYAERLDFKVGN